MIFLGFFQFVFYIFQLNDKERKTNVEKNAIILQYGLAEILSMLFTTLKGKPILYITLNCNLIIF